MGVKVPTGNRRRRVGAAALLALVCTLVPLAAPAAAADDELGADAVVEVVLADRAELDRLVASGADLTHELARRDGALVAQVVVDADQLAELRADGYRIGRTLWTQADTDAVLAEREAAIAAKQQGGAPARSFAAAEDVDALVVLRSDYFTSLDDEQFLYAEVKTSLGSPTSSSPTLTMEWDSGPGTEIGSGGSRTMARFVDAGVYMYHLRQVEVTTRPSRIRITSSAGGTTEAAVTEWLPLDENGNREDPYFKDFVDHYLTPQELYARIEQLHGSTRS